MKLIMTIHVTVHEPIAVKGSERTVTLLPFSAEAEGEYFTGSTIAAGCDTQYHYPDGAFFLSARYMLEGKDFKGQPCRVFIENNGSSLDNCRPRITTDSAALSFLEGTDLKATVEPTDGGEVTIRIGINET